MDLINTPANPLPPDGHQEIIRTEDGFVIRAAHWLARSGARHGTICLMQGRGEYIEKYFETIEFFRQQGFAVATFDWRGQGGSERLLSNRNKGHISDYDRYDADLLAVIEQILKPHCPPPYYALAHSNGGLILLRHVARRKTLFERLVLCAPFLGLGSAYEPVTLAKVLVGVSQSIGLSRLMVPAGSEKPSEATPFLGNLLTSDEARFARNAAIIAAGPSLGIGSPTIGWVAAALRAMADLAGESVIENIRLPILMIGAGNDSIVSNRALETVALRLAMGRHLMLHGARHELMMEQDRFREPFLAACTTFFASTET